MVEMRRFLVPENHVNRTLHALVRLLALTAFVVPCALGVGGAPLQDDEIDALMEKVLERRATNREDLYRYTVRDRETIDITGPGGERIESQIGEYTWYVREGYLVRSPDTLSGAKVGDKEREKAEKEFLELARSRDEARAREAEQADPPSARMLRHRRLEGTGRAYFLGVPFEAGNYLLVGFEEFEGQEVARIEYYPQRLFEEDREEVDAEMIRSIQKSSRVTLWVLVEEHQILKAAWDSLNLDFLPYRWLVQVDDVQGELIMHKPFPDEDVWLPREIVVTGQFTMATGSYTMSYTLEYFDYMKTDVDAEVRFRLRPPGAEPSRHSPPPSSNS
jgi:hypothetical protein